MAQLVLANELTIYRWMPSSAIDIAARLLAYEPGWRMSAEKVINYGAYWNEDPLPEKPVGYAIPHFNVPC